MHRFPIILSLLLAIACISCSRQTSDDFLRVDGENILTSEGDTFFIRGINLGNWLNPEGYMFGFRQCNSASRINEAFCQLIGPERTAAFWQQWRHNYITESDIRYIAQTGANTVRLPFHYLIFTSDPYLGARGEAVAQIDSCIAWCKRYGLRVVLDMHDAPGGQTGDNIDDSYGYPWLMVSPVCQQQFCDIWQHIAERYKDEPTVLGYELINEPIAHYFRDDFDSLNAQLEPLYRRAVSAIRTVDTHHIILLGGAQWNGTFAGVFHDWSFDDNLMYTCHRYHQPPTFEGIRDLIAWRDSTGLCMYMGETGHESIEWTEQSCRLYVDNNIGYTFWPYKKMGRSSWLGFAAPDHWDSVVSFVEGDRSSYAVIRDNRPDQQLAATAIMQLTEACQFSHCTIDSAYIAAMQLRP